jgi:colanic acid biosynthesis glycosyl transferase WcaI
MRVVFLTQYYPPEVGAPQTRISELVQRFVERQHEVIVLTGMPNYPTGKIHPGYGGALMRRQENGIRVVRTWLYPTQKADMKRRMANYLSFTLSSSFFGTALMPRADYLVVESPPLFLGLAGWWLARLHRARMIFNVSDLWPESAVHVGAVDRESRAYRAAERLEALLYRKAWLVSGQSETIVRDIAGRFPSVRTYHLSNGADTTRFHPDRADPEVRRELAPNGEFAVLYAGLHGLAQGLDQVLQAAKLLSAKCSCRFTFLGDGPEKASLVEEADRLGLTNVSFAAPVSSKDMPAMVASADASIIPLKTDIPGAVPSKLYESMASARAIIYVAEGEGADIVRRTNAGLVVHPGDVHAIAEAVERLASDPALRKELGASGRRAAEERFDRSSIANRFIDYLENQGATSKVASTKPL